MTNNVLVFIVNFMAYALIVMLSFSSISPAFVILVLIIVFNMLLLMLFFTFLSSNFMPSLSSVPLSLSLLSSRCSLTPCFLSLSLFTLSVSLASFPASLTRALFSLYVFFSPSPSRCVMFRYTLSLLRPVYTILLHQPASSTLSVLSLLARHSLSSISISVPAPLLSLHHHPLYAFSIAMLLSVCMLYVAPPIYLFAILFHACSFYAFLLYLL